MRRRLCLRRCNIENAGFTATCCAERTAFFRAVNDGKRDFKAIAIAGGRAGEEPTGICAPCGVCRQVMAEFCGPGFEILLTDGTASRCKRWRSSCPWLLAQAIYNKRKKRGLLRFRGSPFCLGKDCIGYACRRFPWPWISGEMRLYTAKVMATSQAALKKVKGTLNQSSAWASVSTAGLMAWYMPKIWGMVKP